MEKSEAGIGKNFAQRLYGEHQWTMERIAEARGGQPEAAPVNTLARNVNAGTTSAKYLDDQDLHRPIRQRLCCWSPARLG
jgi:hypothetical protein